jgi:hypothetical protein
MLFEWKKQDPGSRPGNEQLENRHVEMSLRCTREPATRMTGLDALPHISTMLESPHETHEGQIAKDFRYPQDWDSQWWRRPKVFDLATDNLSSYAIYETIAHYRIVDPDWTFEPVVETWNRIGQLTDIAQLSPQDKLDLCEQELQFSAMIFGREEAKQNNRSEAEWQFLKRHLENCQELYSLMLVEYKNARESYAKVEADDITEFWQYLGKNRPETSFEVMNAFRLDLGRFTFWKQVISRSVVPSDVVTKIDSKFNHLTQVGRSCQHEEVEPICRFVPVSPERYRSLPDLTILRHWSYRTKLRRRVSPFISRERPLD